MKRFLLVVAALLAAVPAFAQTDSLSGLRASGTVHVGDTVVMTDSYGRRAKGKISDLTDSSLVLMGDRGAPRTFNAAGITKIQRDDSVANGILIGLGAGYVAALTTVRAICSSPDPECETIVAFYIGAPIVAGSTVIGGVTDMLIRKTVYMAPNARARLSVVPLVTKERKGVALSLSF